MTDNQLYENGINKIINLTGNINELSEDFISLLKQNDLSLQEGLSIQKKLIEEFEYGLINIDYIEIFFEYLIKKEILKDTLKNNDTSSIKNNLVEDSNKIKNFDEEEKISIYMHNLNYKTRICPNCRKLLLKKDKYCYNCGMELPKIKNAVPKIIKTHTEPKKNLFQRFNQKSINNLKNKYNESIDIKETNHNIIHYDLTINYLINLENKYANKSLWNQYRHLFLEQSRLYSKINDKDKELETALKYFICTINPWRDKIVSFNEEYINSEETEKLIKLIKKHKIRFNRLEELYIHVYKELKIPSEIIPIEESFKYLLNLIIGKTPEEINKEINERIIIDKTKNYTFSNKNQEKVIIKELEKCFK
ncbi:MAG: zinc ribbon domain-containing protein [Methanosphaera stadtmanae]|nr:zinc ribbon domain-containing protein [Methanosphaera stadtmanae]